MRYFLFNIKNNTILKQAFRTREQARNRKVLGLHRIWDDQNQAFVR